MQERATLRTRQGKDGVLDWDAAARGWQAKAAQQAGVDLASVYRRVTRLGRSGRAPRDAGPELTQDQITRAAHKTLERCSRENSTWTRADLTANLGRVLPQCAADVGRQAANPKPSGSSASTTIRNATSQNRNQNPDTGPGRACNGPAALAVPARP